MDETEQDELEVHETPNTEETEQNDQLSPEQIAELKDRAEVSSQNFERAKKFEKELKELREKTTTKQATDISNADILFLAKADIHEDDMDEVLDFAKVKKLSVKEAHEYLKPILAVREEERKTAIASNTRTSSRGTSKVTAEQVLEIAESTRQFPESDDDMAKLAEARLFRHKKRN